MWRSRRAIYIAGMTTLSVLVAVTGLWLGDLPPFAQRGGAAFHGTTLDPLKPAPPFTLNGVGNRQIHLSDFQGKVVLLYFGYTFCPDVCPTTLATLARARASLGTRASEVQVVMITVDPERDTPQVVDQYVKRFDASFIGLSGSLDQISPIAAAYGISFYSHEVPGASGYLVDHTPAVTVIDSQGNRHLIESYGMTDSDIASDIRALLRQ